MKGVIIVFIGTVLLFILVSCGEPVKPQSQAVTIVKTSAPAMPDWVLKKKKAPDMVYFVGMSTRLPDLKQAKKASVDDATSQLVEYIGFRATSRFVSEKVIADADNVSTVRENINQSLEGKGAANVSVDMEDFYYEQYSDNSVQMYTLIKFPNAWVESERARLKKLTDDQRKTASLYLSDADASVKAGNMGKAVDLAINALVISEKAAENADLYEESKTILTLALSSLSFSLDRNARFAYTEGGSDPINLKITSSKTGTGAPGIQTIAYDAESNAAVNAVSGNTSDAAGNVIYTIDKAAADQKSITVISTFSLTKMAQIKNLDPGYYLELEKIQKNQSLKINLTVLNKNKTIPTGLFAVQIYKDSKNPVKIEQPTRFQDTLSQKFAASGFQIIPNSPAINLEALKNSGPGLMDSILASIGKSNPDLKQAVVCIREVNYKGKIGEDVKFTDYDINNTGFYMVDMTVNLTLMDLTTGKIIKGISADSRGQGLNTEQAIQIAEKRVLENLDSRINDF